MIRAQVISPIIGDGLTRETAFRPRLYDIPGVLAFTDDTAGNAPMSPNYAVFTCTFTPEAFVAVLADTENYYVNWSVDNGG